MGTTEPSLGGCYIDVVDSNTHMPDVWERIIADYGIKSVIDVGCGAGWAVKWFYDKDIYVLGVEGWPEAIEKNQCRERIYKHDYTLAPFRPIQTFDLCWCAEFVEHVEEQYIPNFMATFKRCKYVCMTHALPNQDGWHHVNCRDDNYWIAVMHKYGFHFNVEETKKLRATDQGGLWGRCSLMWFENKEMP